MIEKQQQSLFSNVSSQDLLKLLNEFNRPNHRNLTHIKKKDDLLIKDSKISDNDFIVASLLSNQAGVLIAN